MTMNEREKAAGLSGTTSNYGKPTPTMSEREAAAGLSNTTSNYGRRDWSQDNVNSDESVSSGTRVETIRSDSVLPDNSNFRGIVGIAVVKEDESNVIVTEGSVENELFDEVSIAASDGMSIWIKCTLPSEGSPPNAVSAVTSDPGNDTDTKTSRLWATISIDNGFLTVTEHRRGSPDLDSCGSNHVWIF